jgi:hypothetical protein
MRVMIAAVTAASLLVSSAFAAETLSGPLAPGKPAGVQKAQMADTTLLYVLGGGLLIGGVVLLATQGSDNTPAASTPTTPTTTTTGTSP